VKKHPRYPKSKALLAGQELIHSAAVRTVLKRGTKKGKKITRWKGTSRDAGKSGKGRGRYSGKQNKH